MIQTLNQAKKILVIDDEELNVDIIARNLTLEAYEVLSAYDGNSGLNIMNSNDDVNAILLDRKMPGMDGIEVLQKIKSNPKHKDIPVILQTAINDNGSMLEGIKAGAYYYLTKPYNSDLLLSIVKAACADYSYKQNLITELHQTHQMMGYIEHATFSYFSIKESQNLAYFIATSYPDPDKVVFGLAEIMHNAVEHGHLKIGYEEKSNLLRKGTLFDEITRREQLPEHKHKRVKVVFEKKPKEINVTIIDQGNGFNWRDFIELKPERATDPNGRGIILARNMSFDDISFNQKGNEVCCKVLL